MPFISWGRGLEVVWDLSVRDLSGRIVIIGSVYLMEWLEKIVSNYFRDEQGTMFRQVVGLKSNLAQLWSMISFPILCNFNSKLLSTACKWIASPPFDYDYIILEKVLHDQLAWNIPQRKGCLCALGFLWIDLDWVVVLCI